MTTMDINEVCRVLGTTSRTLRYYEEKGIIQSTAVPFRSRRHYSPAQIEDIKKVLVLRSLGLCIADIRQLQQGDVNLSDVIAEHKAKLIASIAMKTKEIRLLDEALDKLESGGDIFTPQDSMEKESDQTFLTIAEHCTDAFLCGELARCFSYFTPTLQSYFPLSAFEQVVRDTLLPIGSFVCKDRRECRRNSVFSYLKYEKLGLIVQFSFNANDRIQGIWFQYYEY